MNKIECKICGSKRISKHIKTKDFFLSQEEFIMNKCLSCDFIFTHLPPNKKEIYQNIRSRSAKLRYGTRNDNLFFYPEQIYKKFKKYFKLEEIKL